MSLSKSWCWYANNCLHFLKCAVPFIKFAKFFCYFLTLCSNIRGKTQTLDLGMMRQVFYHCATAKVRKHNYYKALRYSTHRDIQDRTLKSCQKITQNPNWNVFPPRAIYDHCVGAKWGCGCWQSKQVSVEKEEILYLYSFGWFVVHLQLDFESLFQRLLQG
jgi:hypothetical protein